MTQPTALSMLTEDEVMFRDEIRKFASTAVAPKVMEMDETEKFDPELLKQMFELGLMGIEIPANHGGSEGSFFMACWQTRPNATSTFRNWQAVKLDAIA